MVHGPFLLPQVKGQSEVKVEAEVGLRWSTESGWGYGLGLKHTLHPLISIFLALLICLVAPPPLHISVHPIPKQSCYKSEEDAFQSA